MGKNNFVSSRIQPDRATVVIMSPIIFKHFSLFNICLTQKERFEGDLAISKCVVILCRLMHFNRGQKPLNYIGKLKARTKHSCYWQTAWDSFWRRRGLVNFINPSAWLIRFLIDLDAWLIFNNPTMYERQRGPRQNRANVIYFWRGVMRGETLLGWSHLKKPIAKRLCNNSRFKSTIVKQWFSSLHWEKQRNYFKYFFFQRNLHVKTVRPFTLNYKQTIPYS